MTPPRAASTERDCLARWRGAVPECVASDLGAWQTQQLGYIVRGTE